MRCVECGQDYGVTHNCTRVAVVSLADEPAPPPGFAPRYYARLAFDIARWDDVAIRRASRDSKATAYGASFWAVSVTILLLFTLIPQVQRENLSGPETVIGVAIGLVFGLLVLALLTLAQFALCHFIAKWLLGATGTLVGVMRPLLLSWFVNLLILVPVVGQLAAGIAWIAVLMLVFEEVDGIGRLQAFLISAVVNIAFLLLQFAIFA